MSNNSLILNDANSFFCRLQQRNIKSRLLNLSTLNTRARSRLDKLFLILTSPVIILLGIALQPALTSAHDGIAFQSFLQEFKNIASEAGIRDQTLNDVLAKTTLTRRQLIPDIGRSETSNQQNTSSSKIKNGQNLLLEKGTMIREVASEYQVQPQFILAILGIESNYGNYSGSHSVFDVVSTSAYDMRNNQRHLNELLASFKILDNGDAPYAKMKSSWGGALGYPQFLASSFLHLAVDQDQDGKRDLWSIGPDVIGSIGNFLNLSGWVENQTWGNAVLLPPAFEQSLVKPRTNKSSADPFCQNHHSLREWKTLSQWQSLGIRQPDGSDLPSSSDAELIAALVISEKNTNQNYLVYRNFCSILSYNPSIEYALSVGLLADGIVVLNNE